MEKQTKHRILGVLVLIGLVVIALPFFQTSNELPSEKALLKAPSFPDQAVQSVSSNNTAATTEATTEVATTAPASDSVPDDTIGTSDASIPMTVSTTPLVTPIPDNMLAAAPSDNTVQNQPTVAKTDEAAAATTVSSTTSTSADSETKPEAIKQDALPEGSVKDVAELHDDDSAKKVTKSVTASKSVKHGHKTLTASRQNATKTTRHKMLAGYQVLDPSEVAAATSEKEGYAKIKTSAWVVQLGSFKSKDNALRLVNILRKRGYSSFIEQASSNKHGLTKVMVGPEEKKDHAKTLATKLESEIHVHGIVVNYKPLAL